MTTNRLPYTITRTGDHFYTARSRETGEVVAEGRTRDDCRRFAERWAFGPAEAARREQSARDRRLDAILNDPNKLRALRSKQSK